MGRSVWVGAVSIILVILIWGFHYIVLFHPLRIVSAGQYLTLRFFLASLVLLSFPAFYRLFRNIRPSQWAELVLLGLVSIVWYQWSFLKAVALMDPLPLVLILSLGPILVALVRRLLGQESFFPVQWIGMLVVVMGTGFLLDRRGGGILEHTQWSGLGWAFLCLILFVGQTLLIRRMVGSLTTGQVTFLPILIGGIGLFVWHPSYMILTPVERSPGVILPLLYSTFLALFLAYFLWNEAIRVLGPTEASLWVNAQTMVTAVGATLFLGEPITLPQVGGGFLMMGGFVLFFLPVLLKGRIRPHLLHGKSFRSLFFGLPVNGSGEGNEEERIGVK
ncbi:MAG: DMT family transporter [Leptospirales bacterium]